MNAGLILARHLKGVVIDVGANGGSETHMALAMGREVVAIECLASAYTELLHEFGSNPNVTLLHICAGEATSFMTLHLADDSSSLIKGNIAHGAELQKAQRAHNVAKLNRETVVVAAMDDLVKNTPVALIKIDVQGFEPQVLRGARGILAAYQPVLIYEDFFHAGPARNFRLPKKYVCKTVNQDKVCHVPKGVRRNLV